MLLCAKPVLLLFLGQCVMIGGAGFNHIRQNRHCRHHHHLGSGDSSGMGLGGLYVESISNSNATLIFILVMGVLFFLMFLGLLKGVIGYCCSAAVGIFGLGLLIDLPRPLRKYQEGELKNRQVMYDIGGWPVHPDTFEKTVRVLPKRTEFCLNLIFFLAYPITALVFICSICCCIRNYPKGSDGSVCFDSVNVGENNGNGKAIESYKENDGREEKDTKYVLEAMQKSQSSLRDNNDIAYYEGSYILPPQK